MSSLHNPPDEQQVPAADRDPQTPPAPLLVIDWGVEPQAGKHLSPEFHLVAPGCRERPRVTAILDRHLDRDAWNPTPWPREVDESHWSFFESLDLTRAGQVCRAGQFLLELQVVFPSAGGEPAACYRAIVRVTVPDAAEAANPILEIRGDGSSLVNLQGLDINRYAKIVIQGHGQSVVNVLHADDPNAAAPQAAGRTPSNERLVVRLPLQPHRELQQLIPRCCDHRSAPPLDTATLTLDDGRSIHLLARETVVLGRDGTGSAASDIMLRLFPLDDDRWSLSRLISRQHLRFTLHPDGLALEDRGATFGTYLDGQRLTASRMLSPSATWWLQRHAIDVAGVLGLEVTLHPDRGWDEWTACSDAGESYYAAAVGGAIPPLWHGACKSRIDAVRIRRRAHLPVADHREEMERILGPEHRDQWAAVKHATEAVERIDKLADREQYVFVYRTARIGGADEAAIQIPGLGPHRIPARILNLGSGFWVEGLLAEPAMQLNGRPVAKRELVPLVPGDHLCLDGVTLSFCKFQQIWS